MREIDARTQVRVRRQQAAEKYRPAAIKTLLVAEAPPSADDRYFYFEEVKSHDWLFRGVAQVVLGRERGGLPKGRCLLRFQEMGLFLIDLKLDPLDGTPLNAYVPDLVLRCRALSPERIVLIKATVFDVAFDDLAAAGLPVVNQRVYFPSSGQQTRFLQQFAQALETEL